MALRRAAAVEERIQGAEFRFDIVEHLRDGLHQLLTRPGSAPEIKSAIFCTRHPYGLQGTYWDVYHIYWRAPDERFRIGYYYRRSFEIFGIFPDDIVEDYASMVRPDPRDYWFQLTAMTCEICRTEYSVEFFTERSKDIARRAVVEAFQNCNNTRRNEEITDPGEIQCEFCCPNGEDERDSMSRRLSGGELLANMSEDVEMRAAEIGIDNAPEFNFIQTKLKGTFWDSYSMSWDLPRTITVQHWQHDFFGMYIKARLMQDDGTDPEAISVPNLPGYKARVAEMRCQVCGNEAHVRYMSPSAVSLAFIIVMEAFENITGERSNEDCHEPTPLVCKECAEWPSNTSPYDYLRTFDDLLKVTGYARTTLSGAIQLLAEEEVRLFDSELEHFMGELFLRHIENFAEAFWLRLHNCTTIEEFLEQNPHMTQQDIDDRIPYMRMTRPQTMIIYPEYVSSESDPEELDDSSPREA